MPEMSLPACRSAAPKGAVRAETVLTCQHRATVIPDRAAPSAPAQNPCCCACGTCHQGGVRPLALVHGRASGLLPRRQARSSVTVRPEGVLCWEKAVRSWTGAALAPRLQLQRLALHRPRTFSGGVRLADQQVDPAAAAPVLPVDEARPVHEPVQVRHHHQLGADGMTCPAASRGGAVVERQLSNPVPGGGEVRRGADHLVGGVVPLQ